MNQRLPNRPYLLANGAARLQLDGVMTPLDELSLSWNTRYVHAFFRAWEGGGRQDSKLVIPTQLLHAVALTYALHHDTTALSWTLDVQNLTLVSEPGARCWGMAYRIAPERVEEVLAHLDFREQGGYERHHVLLETRERPVLESLMYLAGPSNPHDLGPASLEEIAAVVRSARGPSGSNLDYVRLLAEALAQAGEDDAHVTELMRLL